ncbi:MAG TPA: 50S ribosomal protein L15 [Nitrospinaceae bacterium]|nr:50S ribosomal protein L15 [Nitrospinaceae bacterium]HAK37108.1 50S ribosomal protein L15 [Nitrospina sp.]MDP6476899.1 50S ribosomal protein L15 [Nitrospinaceae bacterium]MDP6656954.1 50S ribosomal protein L15 [Nitrospinaceae bacterium]MDP6711707.1 50S ribosomal protein L15 [Nitrospinaceae bacterium]|tara:strand:- start:10107 stop:10544 length:438 start_codon:yes stop_codon:yes gene_type:complete
MKLSELRAVPGSRKNRKRIGRGPGSGTGKTSGKGQKGQKSRSGGNPHPWFEGGQMPLYRRLPKRGFTNIFRKEYVIVNVSQLEGLGAGDPVTPEVMKEKGLIRKLGSVKILGNGELSGAVTVHAHKFSRSAVEKIEKSGGKAVTV